MPATNPRLTITLQPTIAAQLRRLSELTGNSQSALISELLDGSAPVFDRVISVLAAASSAKASLRGQVADDMAKAQLRMETHLGLAMDELTTSTQPILDGFEDVQRRARRGAKSKALAVAGTAPGASPAPLSNRGVRSLTNTTKNIAQGQPPSKAKPRKHGVKNRGVKS